MDKKNFIVSVHRLVWQTAYDVVEARTEEEAIMIANDLAENQELVYSDIPDETLSVEYTIYEKSGIPRKHYQGLINRGKLWSKD